MKLHFISFVLEHSKCLFGSFVFFNFSFVYTSFHKAIPVFEYFVFSVESDVLGELDELQAKLQAVCLKLVERGDLVASRFSYDKGIQNDN